MEMSGKRRIRRPKRRLLDSTMNDLSERELSWEEVQDPKKQRPLIKWGMYADEELTLQCDLVQQPPDPCWTNTRIHFVLVAMCLPIMSTSLPLQHPI